MRTLIIGLADPAGGAGAVLRVAELVALNLRHRSDIVIHRDIHRGGMEVLEALAGYDRAFIIDSVISDGGRPGAVHAFRSDQRWPRQYSESDLDADLPAALELGRTAGLPLPDDIRIWAIERSEMARFGGPLSPEVERAAERVAEEIRKLAERWPASEG